MRKTYFPLLFLSFIKFTEPNKNSIFMVFQSLFKALEGKILFFAYFYFKTCWHMFYAQFVTDLGWYIN